MPLGRPSSIPGDETLLALRYSAPPPTPRQLRLIPAAGALLREAPDGRRLLPAMSYCCCFRVLEPLLPARPLPLNHQGPMETHSRGFTQAAVIGNILYFVNICV